MKRICCVVSMAGIFALAGCESGPSTAPTPVATKSSVRNVQPKAPIVAQTPNKPAQVVIPQALTPRKVSLDTAKADVLFLAGKYDEAFKAYQQVIRANHADLDAHDGLSRTATALEKYNEGCSFYENLIRTELANAGLY